MIHMNKIAVVIAVTCWCAGCGLDESYTSLGDEALPGEPLNPITQPVECTGVETTCTTDPGSNLPEPVSLTGKTFRFDSMELTAPITGELGKNINGFFEEQLAADELNVLLRVVTDDREFNTLDMEIGAGTAAEQGYLFDGDRSPLFCFLSGPSFKTLLPSFLPFPNELFEPPELPVSSLKLSGVFAQDGSSISSGVLDGVLTGEDATQVKLLGVDMATQFETMKIDPDVDSTGDGVPDGWRFIFSFTAAPIEVVE